jgi:hypothetical protein
VPFYKKKMEMQQMMEHLLAKMDANQAEMKADRKAMQEKADAGQAEIIAAIEMKMDALITNIKIGRKETMACQYAMETSLKKIEPNSEEKDAAVEQHEIPNEEVAVHSQRTCRSETTPSQEPTETKPDPGMMQSVEEHQEIPKED